MQAIQLAGGESCYHYEEFATYSYKHRIRNREKGLTHLDEIRANFVKNLNYLRKKTGLPCLTVASHGDYVNTKLGVQNTILMTDEVRMQFGLLKESYDKEHLAALSYRLADQVLTDTFTEQAISAYKREYPILELLTLPRQWHSPFLVKWRK